MPLVPSAVVALCAVNVAVTLALVPRTRQRLEAGHAAVTSNDGSASIEAVAQPLVARP